jgi:hypothetical protein
VSTPDCYYRKYKPDKPKQDCPCCEAGLKTEELAIVKAEQIIATTCPRCLVQIRKVDDDVYRCPSCKRPWPPRKVPVVLYLKGKALKEVKDLFSEGQQDV